MATENIKVPDLGDASDVEVIELLVAVGDKVSENDSLLVLESDKAAMEIPAPMSGVVKSIAVNLGDQVSTGNDILTLEVDGESGADKEDGDDKAGSADRDTAAAADKSPGAAADKDSNDEKPAAESAADKSESEASEKGDSGKSTVTAVDVPDLGTDDEVEVIEVHVAVGDSVSADDSLITLESDKAAMEVPSPQDGTVEELLIKVGDKVKTGSKIIQLKVTDSAPAATGGKGEAKETEAEADRSSPAPAKSGADESGADKEPAAQPETPEKRNEKSASAKVYAGPAVRKLARELGVDLTQVQGSGAKSRIVKEDVHEFVKSRINQSPAGGGGFDMPAVEDIDFSQFGEVEKVERSKLDKLTARNMHRNWTLVPHVAQFNEADVTALEDFRAELKPEAEKRGTKLTPLPFLLKACAKALAEFPQFNVSLHSSGEYLIQKKYCHIGVAVATPAGLMVPVIRDVDKKSIWELAEEVSEMTEKAKKRKLGREDMQGACFTISSLGAIGGTGFIPIVNAPEVAILGVSRTTIKPVYLDGEFKPRKMLPLTLSYDHKAVNGVDGGMFADYLVTVLGDIRRLVL